MPTQLDYFSELNRLPYFNTASMLINISDNSATRRLLQCRGFGIAYNDISRKFQKRAADVPDLHEEDFNERKKVVEDVEAWSRRLRTVWTPILYNYEVADNTAKRVMDWGHIVFTDPTFTRFLLVMCYVQDCCPHAKNWQKDCDDQVKYQADRFMSLLQYLFHDAKGDARPRWVRATYTTRTIRLPSNFFESEEPVSRTAGSLPIVHVTAENFKPSLSEGELTRIDSTIRQDKDWKLPPRAVRDRVKINYSRPKPVEIRALSGTSPDLCANCGKVNSGGMRQCSICKLVRYCNRGCQRSHWDEHRRYCRKPESSKKGSVSTMNSVQRAQIEWYEPEHDTISNDQPADVDAVDVEEDWRALRDILFDAPVRPLTMSMPFWEKPWFIGLSLLMLIALVIYTDSQEPIVL